MIESRRMETFGDSVAACPPPLVAVQQPPADMALVDRLLPGVSRTFAVTIPELPGSLRRIVTTAYLLCRIADTIEDESALEASEKVFFLQEFADAACGCGCVEDFSRRLSARLTVSSQPAERDLVRETGQVVRTAESFSPPVQTVLQQCIQTMCGGMASFQGLANPAGLPTLQHTLRYCYFVAGVVGQTLTELFCRHSPLIALHRERLLKLSVPFGQGLQMTNILKDLWTDRKRGACWLPRDLFQSFGFDLTHLEGGRKSKAFQGSLGELIAVARSALEDAGRYVQLLPVYEIGIRRFALRTLFMALLTLRNIWSRHDFSDASQVKISRRTVWATIALTDRIAPCNIAIAGLARIASAGLPSAPTSEIARRAPGPASPIASFTTGLSWSDEI